jgi:predicted amidohydrolase
MNRILLVITFLLILSGTYAQKMTVTIEAPSTSPQYGVAEFVFRVKDPVIQNPFTDIQIKGVFTSGKTVVVVSGFSDSQDGSVFRLRFSPELKDATYNFEISFIGKDIVSKFTGKLASTSPADKGPVIADPAYPKHFIYKATKEPFIHLGCTEYNLLDSTNDDEQVSATIDYCLKNGFNKIRFLVTGYPRDFDNRTSDDVDHGVPLDPWKSPNYGALPGRVNPLPAWIGKPHNYDFERFNVNFWQRVDKAVKLMKEKGIIATCILMIEKQNLPKEIGKLTESEYRLYQYAVARLAAFDNVWWDLGNEHNEYRDADWGNKMGDFVKSIDPYHRLSSAHAYAEFFYSNSSWADFIITQQYGDPDSVHKWTLKYYDVRKPYINEEYGYEGLTEKPVGHGMNSDWVRKCHWAITMAGGYATYGDWSNGISYFYMGIPGPGKAAAQLMNLKLFLEAFPFREMVPSDNLVSKGYCLSKPGKMWIIYLPEGGNTEIDLSSAEKNVVTGNWFNPVNGKWSEAITLTKGKNKISAPSDKDWVFIAASGATPVKKIITGRELLSVASVQMRSSADLTENSSRICRFIEKAASGGADVVIFPECALSGYTDSAARSITVDQIAKAEKEIGTICKKASVYAIVGTPYRDGSKLYNSAIVISSEGVVVERYHKLQLAEAWPDQGDHLSVFNINGIPCSIIICHDERYPELVRLPVLAGAKVIFYISHESGVKEESKIVPYRAQVQARAVENNVFLAQSNAPANPDATGSHGQSRIIAPDGNIITEASVYSEEIIYATLDISKASRGNALKSMSRGVLQDWWKEGVKKVRIIE